MVFGSSDSYIRDSNLMMLLSKFPIQSSRNCGLAFLMNSVNIHSFTFSAFSGISDSSILQVLYTLFYDATITSSILKLYHLLLRFFFRLLYCIFILKGQSTVSDRQFTTSSTVECTNNPNHVPRHFSIESSDSILVVCFFQHQTNLSKWHSDSLQILSKISIISTKPSFL